MEKLSPNNITNGTRKLWHRPNLSKPQQTTTPKEKIVQYSSLDAAKNYSIGILMAKTGSFQSKLTLGSNIRPYMLEMEKDRGYFVDMDSQFEINSDRPVRNPIINLADPEISNILQKLEFEDSIIFNEKGKIKTEDDEIPDALQLVKTGKNSFIAFRIGERDIDILKNIEDIKKETIAPMTPGQKYIVDKDASIDICGFTFKIEDSFEKENQKSVTIYKNKDVQYVPYQDGSSKPVLTIKKFEGNYIVSLEPETGCCLIVNESAKEKYSNVVPFPKAKIQAEEDNIEEKSYEINDETNYETNCETNDETPDFIVNETGTDNSKPEKAIRNKHFINNGIAYDIEAQYKNGELNYVTITKSSASNPNKTVKCYPKNKFELIPPEIMAQIDPTI